MKPIDGMWSTEYYGVFGKERAGFLMLSGGKVVGGGRNHYSRGVYALKGAKVTMRLSLEYFGEPRTLFGERARRFDVEFLGRLSGKHIEGTVTRPKREVVPLQCRLTRLGPVPKPFRRDG